MKDYNEYRIKQLDRDSQTNKTLATLAGATASLATLVTIGSYVLGNDLIVLQNMGTTAAMIGYVVGYTRKTKFNIREKQRIIDNQGKENTQKERLIELKEKFSIIIGNWIYYQIEFFLLVACGVFYVFSPKYYKHQIASILFGVLLYLLFALILYRLRSINRLFHQVDEL